LTRLQFAGLDRWQNEIKFGSADAMHGDLLQIENLAARFLIADVDVERARARAGELLRKHWDAVEWVAAALLDKKTLTGAAIDALFVTAVA
jgi:hypothetical protein